MREERRGDEKAGKGGKKGGGGEKEGVKTSYPKGVCLFFDEWYIVLVKTNTNKIYREKEIVKE